MVPSISSMFEIGNYKKKFIRKQQTELKFKPLNWLAIFCCTLIKYLLNMHFYSLLHASIEEIILMHKNLYLFKNFARSACFKISENILLIYVITFLPQNFKLSLQVMQDDAITSNEVKHFSLEKIYFPRKWMTLMFEDK